MVCRSHCGTLLTSLLATVVSNSFRFHTSKNGPISSLNFTHTTHKEIPVKTSVFNPRRFNTYKTASLTPFLPSLTKNEGGGG